MNHVVNEFPVRRVADNPLISECYLQEVPRYRARNSAHDMLQCILCKWRPKPLWRIWSRPPFVNSP